MQEEEALAPQGKAKDVAPKRADSVDVVTREMEQHCPTLRPRLRESQPNPRIVLQAYAQGIGLR